MSRMTVKDGDLRIILLLALVDLPLNPSAIFWTSTHILPSFSSAGTLNDPEELTKSISKSACNRAGMNRLPRSRMSVLFLKAWPSKEDRFANSASRNLLVSFAHSYACSLPP